MTKKDLRAEFLKAMPQMIIDGRINSYADWLEEYIIKQNTINKNDL